MMMKMMMRKKRLLLKCETKCFPSKFLLLSCNCFNFHFQIYSTFVSISSSFVSSSSSSSSSSSHPHPHRCKNVNLLFLLKQNTKMIMNELQIEMIFCLPGLFIKYIIKMIICLSAKYCILKDAFLPII